MIVMKFGGSSLRSGESLAEVLRIVSRSGRQPKILVLSAVHGVTDQLYRCIDESLRNRRKIDALIQDLFDLHQKIASSSIREITHLRRAMDEIDCRLAQLKILLYGISYTGECTPRIRDKIVSMGERIAVRLLAEALTSVGIRARAADADDIGIYATGRYGNASADLEKIEECLPGAIRPILEEGAIPVITGFLARTHTDQTITFGRGGTDYTASVVARALHADELQIWKDVDGFLTASPEILDDPRPLRHLSYEEAAELAYFGARILHPRTVEPLHAGGIPILIKCTANPDAAGTRIDGEQHRGEEIVKSITYDRRLGIVKCFGAALGCQVGFIHRVVMALSAEEINIRSIITTQTAVSLLLERSDLEPSERIIRSLEIPYLESVEAVSGIAVVAVVGAGLAETRGITARILNAVAMAGINVEMISSGASPVAHYFIVQEEDLKTAIRSIHREFFE